MVLAVLVMTEGGVPVYLKEFSTVFMLDETRKTLIPSLISAITSFIREALGFEAKIISFNSMFLHLVREAGLIVCIIDDRENKRYFDIGKEIARRISRLEIANIVSMTKEEEKKVEGEILNIMRLNPTSLSELRGIYMSIRGFIDEEKCTDKLKEFPIKEPLTEPRTATATRLEEIADALLKFEVVEPKVVKRYFRSKEKEDLAKAIFVINHLMRFDYGLDLDFELEKLLKVALNIKDDVLREVLVARIKSLKDISGSWEFFKILSKHRVEILERLKKPDIWGKTTLLSFMLPNRLIYRILGSHIDEIEWLPQIIREIFMWMRYEYEYIPVFDTFVDEVSQSIVRLEEGADLLESAVVMKKILVILKSLMTFPEADINLFNILGKKFVEAFLKSVELLKKNNAPLSYLIENTSSFDDWTEFLLRVKLDNDIPLNLDLLYNIAIRHLNILLYLMKKNKIDRFFAISSLIRLLKLISILDEKFGKCHYEILKLMEVAFDILTDDLINISWIDYLRHILKILSTSSIYIEKIVSPTFKRSMLNRISKYMDSIIEYMGWEQPEALLNIVSLVSILWRSDDPTAQIMAQAKIKQFKKLFETSLADVLDRIKNIM